ncbi:phage virion morphogenesis protein [Emcibacter sp.]|uniref:phage virion morphogenesis protein n=1 Tax=Emcibacter sp. TaxID=1979954 RepID=UPI002AA95703|nr:phage virion morphogenesis protein [Emcibacter sp.]
MTGLVITVDDSHFQEYLQALAGKLDDMYPVMETISSYLETSTKLRFETGIGPDGQPWKPSIRAQKTGGQTLVKETYLLGSVVSAANSTEAMAGSNMIYARIHQFGGQTGRNHAVTLPARPMFGLDDVDNAEITDTLVEYLTEAA